MSLWCMSGYTDPGRLAHLSAGHTLSGFLTEGAQTQTPAHTLVHVKMKSCAVDFDVFKL